MRNLTITRRKTFVGSAVKMKIYIEDPNAGELTIQNVPCRKLGELKNGETVTFSIGDEAAKVFAIAGNASKDYCCDCYQLSEGEEDITLTGKNHFNLANGNAFLFDGNDSPEVAHYRRKNSAKGMVILIVALVFGLIVGKFAGGFIGKQLFAPKVEPKTFSSHGMTVTLTNQFRETELENYTVCYDSADVAVLAIEEKFSIAEGFEDYSLEEYGELVLIANNQTELELQTADGLTWFTYEATNPETNETFRYYSYVYKADDAFWLVQFTALTKNVDKYQPQIHDWARSVTFS